MGLGNPEFFALRLCFMLLADDQASAVPEWGMMLMPSLVCDQ